MNVGILARIQNLYLHLHRGLLPVRFRRNLRDDAVVFLVGICISRDLRPLCRAKTGEVRLRDIELDLQIIQIRQGNHRTLWAARGCAGELRRNKLAFFCRTVENRARHRRADYRGIQLRLGIIKLPLCLHDCTLGTCNLLCPRANLRELKRLFQGIHALLVGVELGCRIVECLPRDHTSARQFLRAIESELIVHQRSAGFIQIVLRLLNFFRPRSVL